MPYRAVFDEDPSKRGSPEAPLPEGFLHLALAGRDVWNAWRKAYPTKKTADGKWERAVAWRTPPRHQNVDLRHHQIDFSGFEFGDGADFTSQAFSNDGQARFANAVFGEDAILVGLGFPVGAIFTGVRFGDGVRFDVVISSENPHANTEDWCSFQGAHFGKGCMIDLNLDWRLSEAKEVFFNNCKFDAGTRLRVICSNVSPTFDKAIFGELLNLSGSNLSRAAYFRHCVFGDGTSFGNVRFGYVDFTYSRFGSFTDFRGGGPENSSFGTVLFRNTRFAGRADFSNRKFLARSDFSKAHFGSAPLFHDCKLHQDTDFQDALFPKRAEGSGQASRAYRTLKLAMSQHQATREEQLFFRLEMREERVLLWRSRGLKKKFLALLYGLYGLLSDYGQSIWRPTLAFVLFLIVFAGLYAKSSPAAIPWQPGMTTFDCAATVRWMTYSLVSSLPLGGLDAASKELRETLDVTVGPGHAAALVVHKVLSLLSLFLVGLGLRNLFKMK